MKKLLSIILTLVVIFTYTTNVLAAGTTVAPPSASGVHEDFKVDTIENSKADQKIQITNLKTGEVSYIESIFKNGKYKYVSTSKQGAYSVENVNGTISITNEVTKKVRYLRPKQKSNGVQRPQESVPPPDGSYWELQSETDSSYAIDVAGVSLLAGILASLCGGPVTGILVSIASYLISIKAPDVYYSALEFYNKYDPVECENRTYYFSDSTYSHYLGMDSYEYTAY